jgi:hypothetical protein
MSASKANPQGLLARMARWEVLADYREPAEARVG